MESKCPSHYEDLLKIFNIRIYSLLQRLIDIDLKVAYKKVKTEGIVLEKKHKKKITLEGALKNRIGQLQERLLRIVSREYFHNPKFKDKLLVTIEEARNGSNRSLFKLIKFDKSWLMLDWVQKRILEAQEGDDKNFFDNLSYAIKIKKKSRLGKKPEDRDFISLVHRLGELKFLFNMPDNEFRNWLYKHIDKDVILHHPSQLKFQFAKVYFKQYLRRHNI